MTMDRTPEHTCDDVEEAISLLEGIQTIFAHGEDLDRLDGRACTGGHAVARALGLCLGRILTDLHAVGRDHPAEAVGPAPSGATGPTRTVARAVADIEEDSLRLSNLLRVVRDALRWSDHESLAGAVEVLNLALDAAASLRSAVQALQASGIGEEAR